MSKEYSRRGQPWRRRTSTVAASNVNFEAAAAKTLALIGSSGSGKSTVARCVARLERPDAGEIWLNNQNIAALGSRELFAVRPEVQMVFQDPATSMNHRLTAAAAIEEPLLLQRRGSREERRARVAELINEVGLKSDWMNRSVAHFSGGQQQRIAIARALALRPKLLILDEAFSGLDLSTQAQIANLLLELQMAHSLAYLLISHDLTLVSRMADTVAVMCAGKIVEQGTVSEVIANPAHDATRALVSAAGGFRSPFGAVRRPS